MLTRLALERESGGLALAGREGGVAQATPATGGDDDLGAGPDQVGQDLAVLVAHERAVGHLQQQVVAVGAAAVVAGTGLAVAGLAVRLVVVVDERRDVLDHAQHHVAAVSTVAAVGAAEGLELLAMHRRHAVPAVARSDVERHLVDEAGDGHDCSCAANGERDSPLTRTAPFGRVGSLVTSPELFGPGLPPERC